MALADAMRQGAAQGSQQQPPGLRPGMGGEACGGCRYFKVQDVAGRGACRLYGGFPVSAGQVCDSFRPKGA
jgi:hypothetical protein